jgi:hypothetical protein
LTAGFDVVEEIARKVNREIAAYERTQHPAGPGPSHPAPKFTEVDFSQPTGSAQTVANIKFDLFNTGGTE